MKGRVREWIGRCSGRHREGISKGMDGKWIAYIVECQGELRCTRHASEMKRRYDKNGANKGQLAVDTSVRFVDTYKADIGVGAEVQGESDERVRCRRRAERIR